MFPKYIPYRVRRPRGPSRLSGRAWDLLAYGLVGALLLGGAIVATLYLGAGEPARSLGADVAGPLERVVDGDTLLLEGQRIRLAGVDAPESGQSCTDRAGKPWACGEAAAARLKTLSRGQQVRCAPQGYDQYGRLLAVCSVAGQDLGRVLVAEGLAVSFHDYRKEESAARSAERGVWQGPFELPSDWRRQERGEAVAAGPPGAGNPSRFERFLSWVAGLLSN